MRLRLSTAWLLFASATARADQQIETPEAFLAEVFGSQTPTPQVLWLDNAAQTQLTPIFGHPYAQARVHFWHAGTRSAWILDEIGKEFPITAGFAVEHSQVSLARVLTYRESRGDEIRYPSFLKQFTGTHLQGEQLLPQVDGISGATLSVTAMGRMARAALTLDALAQASTP